MQSHHIAHTEPLLKYLGLVKVEDMFSLKIIKLLHKLSPNDLPPYFQQYKPFLGKNYYSV